MSWKAAAANGAPVVVLPAGGAGIELVRVPPGEFTMGSPRSERGHGENEEPQRRIRISRPFYLARFPTTNAVYRAVMNLPSSPEPNLPLSQITYSDAVAFCDRLLTATGATIRLPYEAQWEYACRAGTQTPYSSGSSVADLSRAGWYRGNSGDTAHPVGEKEPNAWGLYDMHGNVWELCADFADYASMADVDPVGRVSPTYGAMRGGGWMHDAEECRSATRFISDDMFGGAGFRIALIP